MPKHRRALHQGERDRSARSRARSRESPSAHGRAATPSPIATSASTSTRSTPGRQKARGQRRCRRMEQRQTGGQQRDGEGQQDGEGLGLDEESLADPEQAEQEIAEARTTSRSRRPRRRWRRTSATAVRVPRAIAPSISQTSTGSVIHSTGQAKNGAIASTEAAPGDERAPPRATPAARPFTRSASAAIDSMRAAWASQSRGRRASSARQRSSQGLAAARHRRQCPRHVHPAASSRGADRHRAPRTRCPLGWRISSPRAGTRPTSANMRPPSVSMSASSSGFSSLMPR